MKKTSLLLLAAMLISFSNFSAVVSALYIGAQGGNYDPSEVELYLDSDGSATDYTSEATNTTSDDVPFPQLEDDALYIFSGSPFDGITVKFSTEESGFPSSDGAYTLEYKTDAGWESIPRDGLISSYDLDNDYSYLDGTSTFNIYWDRSEMSDWTDSYETIDESDRYAIRMRVTSDYGDQAIAQNISLIVANLVLTLEDELGNPIEIADDRVNLMSMSGEDDAIYSSIYLEDGINGLGVAAPSTTGDDYLFEIYAPGYLVDAGEESGIDLRQSSQYFYSTTLTTAHVYTATDAYGNDVDVTAADASGNGDPVDCYVSDNMAYCPIDYDQDNDDSTDIYADGFVAQNILNADREDPTSAQETYDVEFEYAYVISLEDAEGTAIEGATVTVGDDDLACLEVSTGEYACALVIGDSATYSVAKSGYSSVDGTFSSTREDDFDASVSETVVLEESAEETEEVAEDDSEETADEETSDEEETAEEETTDEEGDTEDTDEDSETTDDEDSEETDDDSSEEIITSDAADDDIECEHEWSDITGHWGEKAICLVTNAGYVDAYEGEDIYAPDTATTRADFLKLVLLNAGFEVEAVEGVEYTDMTEDHEDYKWVSFATDQGFVKGYDVDGTFRPDAEINRVEALIMILRVAGVEDFEVTESEVPFTDVVVGDWFDWVVFAGLENGLVRGYSDSTFRPDRAISRAEMALIARRVYYSFYLSEI